jgi:hypothetical protein
MILDHEHDDLELDSFSEHTDQTLKDQNTNDEDYLPSSNNG